MKGALFAIYTVVFWLILVAALVITVWGIVHGS